MMAVSILFLAFAIGFPAAAQAAGEVLAEVDGVVITSEEVEKPLASQLNKLDALIT